VHQPKYTKEIVRKFKMEDSKAMVTPMSMTTTLDAEEEGEHVDQEYRSMIGSLIYLTATRPDIHFSVYVCVLIFKHLQGLRIDKKSSAYPSIFDILPTSAFGTSLDLRVFGFLFDVL
jgi:hypothetical protein